MKIVGNKKRSEFETDPQKVWQRARALDAAMQIGLTPHPRGVWRMTHTEMNAFDLQRQRAQAARLNASTISDSDKKDQLDKLMLKKLQKQ